MTVDFFVHPDYGMREIATADGKRAYVEDMMRLASNSQQPVLLRGSVIGSIEHYLMSRSPCVFRTEYDERADSGIVVAEDWGYFTDFVEHVRGSSMRVHGAFFGCCTETFAMQLAAYLKGHGNIFLYEDDDTVERLCLFERDGFFLHSPVRYGSVRAPSRINPVQVNVVSPFDTLPHGNVTHQFMDSRTELYEKDAVYFI